MPSESKITANHRIRGLIRISSKLLLRKLKLHSANRETDNTFF